MKNGEKQSKRKQEILDVAERLFKIHGYDKTTVQMIADELNTSKGAITYHFKNKCRIMYELLSAYINPLLKFIGANLTEDFNQYLFFSLFIIYSYRFAMKCEKTWQFLYHKEVVSIWLEEQREFTEDAYRKIAKDFHKEFTEDDIYFAAVVDTATETYMFKDFISGKISIDRYCYYQLYLAGLLLRLDEVTIQKNIARAFEFADSHTPPDIFKFR